MSGSGPARRAELADLDMLTSVVVDACLQTAVAAWLVADPDERRQVLHAYTGMALTHAVRRGQVWTIDAAAVAVWERHPGGTTAVPVDGQSWLDVDCGRHANAFRTLTTHIDTRRPTTVHQHLTLLAVAPDRQRHGLGTQLLDHHDRITGPAMSHDYVAASSVTARRLLLRHGFRDHGAPIDLRHGPRLWPLLRHRTPTDHREHRDQPA